MEPILIDSWSRADNALRTLCITQADWSIRWHLHHHYGITTPEYERRGSKHVGDQRFDVYEALIPSGRREYWMNVSYWSGHGIQMEPTRLNTPPPGLSMTVLEFLGESEVSNLPFNDDYMERIRRPLGEIGLQFAAYASRQHYNNVAQILFDDDVPTVYTTAVRRFLADSLPLFHGFRFVKPFLMHQVMHLLYHANPALTEVKPKSNYVLPVPGVDCVSFTPAVHETPAGDFWNYMLWAHRPGAFESEIERMILTASARTAVAGEFVKLVELVDALECLDVHGGDGEVLRALARTWLTAPDGH